MALYRSLDISYPVVQGPTTMRIFHTTYEGTSNFAGSIFLDYQNQDDFSDGNTIVYGHNMKNLHVRKIETDEGAGKI